MKNLALAAVAAFAIGTAQPAMAHPGGDHLTINGVNFDRDGEDLLEQLIALDADDIDELREEFADAREDVLDAIADVEEAREEASEVVGGGVIVKIALKTASAVVDGTVTEVLNDVRASIDNAEVELESGDVEVSQEEMVETREAISVIRTGIDGIEDALGELLAAMRD